MMNVNMEKTMRLMTKQFSQLASSSTELGTLPSQPEMNPKGLPSSSRLPSNDNVRKINAVISLRSGREIDNQVRNSKEPCKFSHDFFENSFLSRSPKTGSSKNSGDTTDGVPINFQKDLPSNSSLDQKELQENDPIDLSSLKDSSSPSCTEKVQKPVTPLPPFPHRLKKKD